MADARDQPDNPFEDLHDVLEAEEEARGDLVEKQVEARTTYTINPKALPLEHADLATLADLLERELRLTFDVEKLNRRVGVLPRDVSLGDLMTMARKTRPSPDLGFCHGMLTVTDDSGDMVRITPISYAGFTTETVYAQVVGSTSESSRVAQRLAEYLWDACGYKRAWKDLRDEVQMVGHHSVTEIDFGLPLEHWLSDGFRSFLSREIQGNSSGEGTESAGARMGRQRLDGPAGTDVPRLVVVPYVENIGFNIAVFDPESGRQEECDLGFRMRRRTDARRGVVTATSELPSREHTAVLTLLREYLRAS